MTKRTQKILFFIFLILGLTVFYFNVRALNLSDLTKIEHEPLILFVFVICVSFIWIIGYTYSWYLLVYRRLKNVRFKNFFLVRMVGDAVSWITPFGIVAGDPMRYSLMTTAPDLKTILAHSIVIDRLLHSIATLAFNLMGLSVLVYHFDLPYKQMIFIFNGFLLIVLLLILMEKTQSYLLLLLAKFSFQRLRKKLIGIEKELSSLKIKEGVLYLAFIGHFFGRLLGALEISGLFWFFGSEFNFELGVVVATLTSLIHLFFSFVPLGIGIVESFYIQFFSFYGSTPEMGLVIQAYRRMRGLFWIFLGLMVSPYVANIKFKSERNPL